MNPVWSGLAGLAGTGLVWTGLVRPRQAWWSGMVWYGLVRSGQVWSDLAWSCLARYGLVGRSGRSGMVRPGLARSGLVGLVRPALALSGRSGLLRSGLAPYGLFCYGMVCGGTQWYNAMNRDNRGISQTTLNLGKYDTESCAEFGPNRPDTCR